MFYYRLPYILFRDYPDFGYLTDNRNFGYDTACKSCIKVGDRILSKSGSIFYSVLTESPQSLKDISRRLLRYFDGVKVEDIEADARSFFNDLAEDGFIGCGNNKEYSRAAYFSYENKTPTDLQEDENLVGNKEVVFQKWGEDYHLSRVHLEVTGLCNERCVHCYFPESYRTGWMSRELFQTILEQCEKCNVLSITISGGEPMLNPNLLYFIRECRKKNFSINLLSNLTLLTEEMLQEFIRTPLLSIQTSLYSMIAEVHDSITTVRGSFDGTKSAIEKLHKLDIPMQINCPIMKQNKDSYQEVLNWAKERNIEADSDYLLFGCFDGSGKNLKCRLELSELEPFIKKIPDHGEIDGRIRQVVKRDYSICPVCVSSICVSHSGNVYPCEGWQNHNLGNVRDIPLKKIWEESAEIMELRSLSYDDFPQCSICKEKDFCSICLIRNANESRTGDFKQINQYYCKVARMKRLFAEKRNT